MRKLATLIAVAAIAIAAPSVSNAVCPGHGPGHGGHAGHHGGHMGHAAPQYTGSYGLPAGHYRGDGHHHGARYGTRQGYAAGQLVSCGQANCNPCPRPCDPCAGGGFGGGLNIGLGF